MKNSNVKNKILITVGGAFVITALVFCLFQWVFVSEERKIERIIQTAERAFEKEDPELLIGFISKEYQDEMEFDHYSLREGLYETFSLFDKIKVSLSDIEVEVEGEKAKAQLDLWIFAKNQDQPVFLVGSLNNPAPAVLFFQKEEGGWKVVRSVFSLNF